MSFSKLRTRSIRFVVALLLIFGGAAALSAGTQGSAVAASAGCVSQYSSTDGAWLVPSGCTAVPIPGAHTCESLGTTGTTQGVACADIYATNSGGTFQVWGEGVYYCQGEYVQCLGMNVDVSFSITDLTTRGETGPVPLVHYTCNPDVGACPSSAAYPAMVSTEHIDVDPNDGFATYSFLPAGQVISVNGASAAYHSTKELDGPPNEDLILEFS